MVHGTQRPWQGRPRQLHDPQRVFPRISKRSRGGLGAPPASSFLPPQTRNAAPTATCCPGNAGNRLRPAVTVQGASAGLQLPSGRGPTKVALGFRATLPFR